MYVAAGYSGLQIIDVSNPDSPTIVGNVDLPTLATGVVVSGGLAYVAGGAAVGGQVSGLQVIDVSNPMSPVILGSVETPGGSLDVAVHGTVAYVADGSSGTAVIDISNPESPVLLGIVDNPSVGPGPYAVVVTGTVVYVADYAWGLVTLPTQCEFPTPVRLTSFTATPRADGILLEWGTSNEVAFAGFHVQRSLQSEKGYERITTESISAGTSYRYVDHDVSAAITYYYRLEALDRTGTQEFFGPVSARMESAEIRPVLGQAFPNPCGASSVIPFAMVTSGNVRIRILDLAGREVRGLFDGVLDPGEHAITWDGTNGRGERVPAGIYLYELRSRTFEATRKLVRLR